MRTFFMLYVVPCNALMSLRSINRGPRGILCTRGEKAQTSKRVSVIACDNVISKAQFATHLPEGNRIAFGKRCMPLASDVECATMRLAARYVPSARCGGICDIKKP